MQLTPDNTDTLPIHKELFAVKVMISACFILALFKLMIVSGEEVIAVPYDQLTYILAASKGYWLTSTYQDATFIRLPIYPLWIGLIYLTGLPLRIGIELLYLFSGFIFILALSKSHIPKVICILFYGLIVFHPVSFSLFNHTLTETLYVSILLLTLASVFMVWQNLMSSANIRYILIFGILVSLLWHIRPENPLLVCIIVFINIITLFLLQRLGVPWASLIKRLSVLVFVPILAIITVSVLIQTANYKKFGLFLPYEMSAPGYTAAYKALISIRPTKSIRFVPISKNTRSIVYSVSPAFKELEPYLESESNLWAKVSRDAMGIQNEIAAGWFYWALREAAALAGHNHSAREADAYYQRVADEINVAIHEGRLPGRFVLFSFLDPDVANYLPFLPESFAKMWRLFTTVNEPIRGHDFADLPQNVREIFDIVANRRTALTNYDVITLQGWVFNDKEPIKQINLRSAAGKILGTTEKFSPRPDVAKGYMENGIPNVPTDTGFNLTTIQGGQLSDSNIVITTNKHIEFVIPYQNISIGKPLTVIEPNTGQKVTYALDKVTQPQGSGKIQKSIQSLIWSVYGKLVAYLTYISLFCGMLVILLHKKVKLPGDIYAILALLLLVVISRIALFALLDASSWPSDLLRYLFPVMPVYTCFLVLFISQTASAIKQAFLHKPTSNTP